MSVNASMLHFEEHLNATVYIGLAGHQKNKAEDAVSCGLSVAYRTQGAESLMLWHRAPDIPERMCS